MIPINQVVYVQSTVDEISQAFENLTSGLLGNKAITDPSMAADVPSANTNNNIPSQINPSIISSELVP